MRDKLVDALTLFLSSKGHRENYSLKDIETFLVFPLKYGRMKVFYEDEKPVGLVSWAFLSPEAEKQYQTFSTLSEDDFKSVDGTLWGLDVVSNGKSTREMLSYLSRLKKKVYPDHSGSIKFTRFDPTDSRNHKVRL